MNTKKNKSPQSNNKQQALSSASLPTEHLDENDISEIVKLTKLNKGLKQANKELTNENRQLKIKLGKFAESEKKYIKKINALTVELGLTTHKQSQSINEIKKLHVKMVRLSKDFVDIIINGSKPVSCLNNNTLNESINDDGTRRNLNKSNGQQTRVVKPMISGHTIQKPVINLPRVSAEQLERLGQAHHETEEENQAEMEEEVVEGERDYFNGVSNVTEDDDNTDIINVLHLSVEPNQNVEVDEYDVDISLAVEESDDNSEIEQVNRIENVALSTIAEIAESAISSHALVSEDTNINETDAPPSTRTTTRQRSLTDTENPFVPSACIARTPLRGNRSNARAQNCSSALDMFSDISNTISNGHVTLRRGVPRKRLNHSNGYAKEEIMTTMTATPSSTKQEEEEEDVPDNTTISNTMFLTDLETMQATVTSTPAITVNLGKRGRTRRATENKHESITPTTLKNSIKKQSCSVVLERMPVQENLQSPPRSSPTTSNSSFNSVLESVLPKRARPSRKAKPTNLKEPKLNKKLRKA